LRISVPSSARLLLLLSKFRRINWVYILGCYLLVELVAVEDEVALDEGIEVGMRENPE
jgi:hypothetical protein